MGVEVASATTKHKQSTRWWTVRVFRTDDGYVAGIGHLTCWEGERDEYWVDKAKSQTGVLASVQRRIPALVRDIADQLRGARVNGIKHKLAILLAALVFIVPTVRADQVADDFTYALRAYNQSVAQRSIQDCECWQENLSIKQTVARYAQRYLVYTHESSRGELAGLAREWITNTEREAALLSQWQCTDQTEVMQDLIQALKSLTSELEAVRQAWLQGVASGLERQPR
jgi:acyl-homoserine lactone acylase PvdQ